MKIRKIIFESVVINFQTNQSNFMFQVLRLKHGVIEIVYCFI